MTYRISAIIPVCNVENYLEQCLDSVINQTLADIEIICVNDGSTDSSGEILEKYAKKDDRIKLINKENGGYGSACNKGLEIASGEFISIVESDDYIDTNMFEDLYNLSIKYNTDIVKSAYYEYTDLLDGDFSLNKINWSSQYNMPENEVFDIKDCSQLLYFHPSIWSCLYSREFLNKHNIRFVEAKGGGWVDNPFQVQTLCLAERIFYTDNAYYYYRLTNPTSSSNIVNISYPFDRSDEVHQFLDENKINDENLLAHLYKRELGYIHIVLRGIGKNLFKKAAEKILEMVNRMDKKIILENDLINEYERNFYDTCQTDDGIYSIMCLLQKNKNNVIVTN
ncbi:MAG: glycosyltransferase [Candidatus Gastranaerophilales bacterium]|nr:glycosyltransferase [Candidatus Gastranaerophilales bacterium]